MKSCVLLALTAVASINGRLLLSEQNMDDVAFFSGSFYNLYNGFVRGFYREHKTKVVSEECMGTWLQNNITHIDNVLERVADLDFEIPYEDAMEAARDTVNIIYKNKEYCEFSKVMTDVMSICSDEENCITDVQLMTNL